VGSFDSAWVLVIEDARDQAELCSDICTEAGLNAMTAATGVQGYRKACDLQPAVIVLDLMLPDTDGWEVCRRLKTDARTKLIPIVILTARDEPNSLAAPRRHMTRACGRPIDRKDYRRRLRREEIFGMDDGAERRDGASVDSRKRPLIHRANRPPRLGGRDL
jgi:CheY-like chemotaxis protein